MGSLIWAKSVNNRWLSATEQWIAGIGACWVWCLLGWKTTVISQSFRRKEEVTAAIKILGQVPLNGLICDRKEISLRRNPHWLQEIRVGFTGKGQFCTRWLPFLDCAFADEVTGELR